MAKPQAIHLMVDLETLDTAPTAHVLSASVVMFDPVTGEVTALTPDSERTTEAFKSILYSFVSKKPINFGLKTQKGATTSTSTLAWWQKTNATYFQELAGEHNDACFERFITGFNDMMKYLVKEQELDVCIWCTGSFDLDILRSASERYGLRWQVPYWAYKDVRVARQIAEDFELIGDMEASHNAYEDCLRQIKYVSAVYGRLNHTRTI